jgi:hypothetical protein
MQSDALLIIAVWAAGAGLGGALGFVLGRYAWPNAPTVDPTELSALRSDFARVDAECIAWRSRAEASETQHQAAVGDLRRQSEENARLSERATGLASQITEQTEVTRNLDIRREA